MLEARTNHTRGPPFTDKAVSLLIKNILGALVHIHERDIMHRDLKPQNILFGDRNDLSSVKIIDFGLSEKYVLKNEFSNE